MLLVTYFRRLRVLATRDAGLAFGPAGAGGPADAGGAISAGGGRTGFLTALWDSPDISRFDVPPAIQAIRVIVLVMVIITVPLSTPHLGQGPQGLGVTVALAVTAVAWAGWQFASGRPRLWLVLIVIMGASSGVLAGLSTLSTAIAAGFAVVVSAGARLSLRASLAVLAETMAAFLITALLSGAVGEAIIGWSAGFLGMWAFGLTRRAYILRTVEAEQALEQARRAHAAETQAAALAERARIAREIHDVLAHALAAVSVNLQAAEGLLDAVPGQGPELAKAIECVQRAGALTKEGMAETRRAILALRDDSIDAAPGYTVLAARPAGDAGAAGSASAAADARDAGDAGSEEGRLPDRLRALADEHRAAGDADVEFSVAGTPHPLPAERAMAVYRTAQEALTNARKHAPGQPVRVTVTYQPDDVTLGVSNALPDKGEDADTGTGPAGPLARSGSGYGLTGLRERAALTGGTLTVGPADGRWQVRLRFPA